MSNMKKNIWYCFILLMMGTTISIGLSSCGDDNDDDEETIDDGKNSEEEIPEIDPVPDRLKPFIGFWEIRNSYTGWGTFPEYDIMFYQDGKCELLQENNNNYYLTPKLYSWDYDKDTKILGIAGMSGGQWQITVVGDNAWSGLALWFTGHNGYNANRPSNSGHNDLKRIAQVQFAHKWVNGDVKTVYYNGYNGYYYEHYFYVDLPYQRKTRAEGRSFNNMKLDLNEVPYDSEWTPIITYTYDKEKDVLTIHNESERSQSYAGSQDEKRQFVHVDIVHPYSYKDAYIIFNYRDYDYLYKGKFVKE